jgi:hypothetical protein
MHSRLFTIYALLLRGLPLAAMLSANATHAQGTDAVAARLRATFPSMPANARVETTVMPGIFAMRVPGFAGCPVYTDEQVSMVANNGRQGWVNVSTGKPLDEARSRDLVARVYSTLPATLIRAGVGKDSGMVLVSGVDCQPSAAMEATLAQRRVGYRILPAALKQANLPIAQAAACAADGSAAWDSIRQGKAPRAASCSVDATELKDLSCMLMGGRLPTAIFPDGRMSSHPRDIEPLLTGR